MSKSPNLPYFMSSEHLLSLPKSFYPWFDVCHIIVCLVKIREDCGTRKFAFDHPLATLISAIISVFAGSLITNPLLAKPVISALEDELLLFYTCFVFALVFFAPADLFYRFVKSKSIWMAINVVKEVYRGKKIYAGLMEGAASSLSSSLFVPVLIATIKGNGQAFMTPLARAVRGQLRPEATELMNVSVSTKECLLAAITMAMVGLDDVCYLGLLGLFLSVRLSGISGRQFDPFAPFVNFLFGVLDKFAASFENNENVKPSKRAKKE